MSKAFTRDDGAEEAPLIPPRAALPEGTPNLVTPRGLELLEAERAEIESERSPLLATATDDAAARQRLALLNGRLAELAERITSPQLVDPRQQSAPADVIRFGATVALRVSSDDGEEERRFRIVGVDEADPNRGLIAFVAPIARAVLGCREGDTAILETNRGEQELEVLSVAYESE